MNTIFAAVAAAGVLGAGVVAGVFVAPQFTQEGALTGASAEGPLFRGVETLRFEDPEGDTNDMATGLLTAADLLAPLPLPTTRDDPHLDIVGVSLAEPSEDLVVLTLEIAQLEEGLAALAPTTGTHRMVTYGVCLAPAEEGCDRAAYLFAMRHGEKTHLEARFDAYVDECNAWGWCSWPLAVDVQYGAPATITFSIAKAWVATGDALDVHHLEAAVMWNDQPTVFPMWHGGWTLHTPAAHLHDHTPMAGLYGLADMTEPLAAGVTLAPPRTAPVAEMDAPLANGHGTMTHAQGTSYDRAEMDLVGFDVFEEDGGLGVLIALQEVREHPTYDFDYALALGFEGQHVLEIGYRQEQGEPMGYAGICIMEQCDESRTHEVHARIVPGAPAFLEIHVPAHVLEDLVDLEPGAATTLAWISTMATDGSQYFGDYEGAVYGDLHHAFMTDEIVATLPFVWGSGHRASPEAFGAAPSEHRH